MQNQLHRWFDQVVVSVIVDYTCGPSEFWYWRMIDCLKDIKSRNSDEMNQDDWVRSSGIISHHVEYDSRTNIVYDELMELLCVDSDVGMWTGTDGNRMTTLVFGYLGWFYGWYSDIHSRDLLFVPIFHRRRSRGKELGHLP